MSILREKIRLALENAAENGHDFKGMNDHQVAMDMLKYDADLEDEDLHEVTFIIALLREEQAKAQWDSHADMVADLAKDGKLIVDELTPTSAHLWHMASCIQGEAGELFDAIKKVAVYGYPLKDLDMVNVIEELGDIEFYMEGLRAELGITREQTIHANMTKLGKRYSSGKFSNQQAKERSDKNGD